MDSQWLFTWPSLAVDGADHAGIASQRLGASPSIVYSTNATGSWVTGTVTTGDARYPSVRFDSADHPALAFARYDGTRGIYLTTKTTGSWAAPTLVSADADPSAPSLALNGANKRGIAWTSNYSFAPGLYFATDASGVWVKTRITTGTWDSRPALQFDAAGKAHVMFTRYAPDSPGIYSATNVTGSWVTTRVTSQLDDAVQFVLDGTGKAHAAFRRNTGMYYATNTSGSWVLTNLPYGDPTGFGPPSIALDANGAPHVVFAVFGWGGWLPSTGQLVHYFKDVGGWTTAPAPEDADTRSDNLPAVGFLSDNTLQLAFRRLNPAAAVELFSSGTPTVIAAGHLDGGPSLDLGPSGERQVAFNRRDGAGAAAILATNSGGGWSQQTAGNGNPSQFGTDIAVDTAGEIRLADGASVYSNETASWVSGPSLPQYAETEIDVDGTFDTHAAVSYFPLSLPVQWWFKYWTNATGSWVSEDSIPIQSWVGFYDDPSPDIAVDAAGKPHIVFVAPQGPCCGGNSSNLFYQNKVSGSWSAPESVQLGIRANWPSIVIDGAGKVHIAFERYTNDWGSDPRPGIWYVTNASGSWVATRLTRSYGDGPPSIALDATGHVYIATTRATWAAHPGVYVMTNATGSWVVSRVYAGAAVDVSIAVTSAGLARIAFDTDTAIVEWENSVATLAAALTAGVDGTSESTDLPWTKVGMSTEIGPASDPSESGSTAGALLDAGTDAPRLSGTQTAPLPRFGH